MLSDNTQNSIRHIRDSFGPMTPFRWLVLALFAVPLFMSPLLFIFWGGLAAMIFGVRVIRLWLEAKLGS